MPKIYSGLPSPVMQALLETEEFVGKYELAVEKDADIKIYAKQLPPAPYRIGQIIDLIKAPAKTIIINGVEFDFAAKTIKKDGFKVSLTEKEANIISLLSSVGKPLSREALLQAIWQYAPDATTNTVETHIYRLRQKLTENFQVEVIDTIKGEYSITDAR